MEVELLALLALAEELLGHAEQCAMPELRQSLQVIANKLLEISQTIAAPIDPMAS